MTSRERWTVYPLLFLALGLAVRAAVLTDERLAGSLETVDAERVQCRSLLVRDVDGTVLLQVPADAAE